MPRLGGHTVAQPSDHSGVAVPPCRIWILYVYVNLWGCMLHLVYMDVTDIRAWYHINAGRMNVIQNKFWRAVFQKKNFFLKR